MVVVGLLIRIPFTDQVQNAILPSLNCHFVVSSVKGIRFDTAIFPNS